jgi:hypothetical protein
MSHNISQFFTAQTSPLFYKIQRILYKFQFTEFDRITPDVYIYGGFVRDMIQHYYNPTEQFNFNNVNVWLDCSPYRHNFESVYDFFDSIFQQLQEDEDIIIEDMTYSYYDISEKFNLANMTIDSIKFNFSTDISRPNFDNLCDFTVNNLFMDIHGNMYKRSKCEYSVNQIIQDIKHKKLVKIFNEEYFNQINDYYKYQNYEDDEEYGEQYGEQYCEPDYNFHEVYPKLETKMKSYGYYNLIGDKVGNIVDEV